MNMLHTPSDKLVSLIKTQYVALTEVQRATYINNTNREPNETGCVQGVFLHVGDHVYLVDDAEELGPAMLIINTPLEEHGYQAIRVQDIVRASFD